MEAQAMISAEWGFFIHIEIASRWVTAGAHCLYFLVALLTGANLEPENSFRLLRSEISLARLVGVEECEKSFTHNYMIFIDFLMIFDDFHWFSVVFDACAQNVYKIQNRDQKSRPGQLPVRIFPSSDGVERKTGYVGLPTHRVLSREQLFETNRTS